MVVTEVPTRDRYIVKPLVERLFEDIGSHGDIQVLANPHIRGIEQAFASVSNVVARYPTVDIFIVVLDRDADPNRADRITWRRGHRFPNGRFSAAWLMKRSKHGCSECNGRVATNIFRPGGGTTSVPSGKSRSASSIRLWPWCATLGSLARVGRSSCETAASVGSCDGAQNWTNCGNGCAFPWRGLHDHRPSQPSARVSRRAPARSPRSRSSSQPCVAKSPVLPHRPAASTIASASAEPSPSSPRSSRASADTHGAR